MVDFSEPFQAFLRKGDPLVSVVVPCYQNAHYLHECVESIVQQDYAFLEILIVNDGSTDNTSSVSRDLIQSYSHREIRLLEKVNGGVSDARNFGLERARGRVVMCLDADDKIKPKYISTAIRMMRDTEANLFKASQQNFGLEDSEWVPRQYDQYFIRYDNCIPTPAVFDKALWIESGGFNVSLGYVEDWDFWVSISRLGLRVVQSYDKLSMYRVSNDGLHSIHHKNWRDIVSVIIISNSDLFSVEEVLEAHAQLPKIGEASKKRVAQLDQLHSDRWLSKFWLGLLAESSNNVAPAVELYRSAIELSVGAEWQPIFRLASVLDQQQRHDQVLALLHAVRTLRPDMSKFVNKRIIELNQHLS